MARPVGKPEMNLGVDNLRVLSRILQRTLPCAPLRRNGIDRVEIRADAAAMSRRAPYPCR